MSTEQTEQMADRAEIERLRSQIAQLEDELASLQAWANEVVADAQKRVYWLDRLHLDLDPIMRHVPIDFALNAYRRLMHWWYLFVLRPWYLFVLRPVDAVRRFVRWLSP
jgi:hypothetical protein